MKIKFINIILGSYLDIIQLCIALFQFNKDISTNIFQISIFRTGMIIKKRKITVEYNIAKK